jgi:hypothetical protein
MKIGLTLFLLGLASSLHAQGEIEGSFIFSSRMTAEEGCALAVQALKRQAVARQCGSQMSGGALRAVSDSSDALYRLHFETTGGRVVSYAETAKRVTPVEGEALLIRCTVAARLDIQCDQGRRDPAFIPTPENQVKLNRSVFQEGDPMQIAIRLPADLPGQVQISIVQMLPYWEDEKRVWRLYPNDHQPASALGAGDTLTLPNAAYSLDPTLPKGRRSVEESLMVVFSRTPLSLPDSLTIEQFHRALAEIPLNERRELVLGYRIEARTR